MIQELRAFNLAHGRLVLILLVFLIPVFEAFAQSDGSKNTGFTTGTGVDRAIEKLIVQPDGKILLVGNFTKYNGTARDGIVRVSSTGVLDGTFTPGAGANFVVQSMALQPDGNILIGGRFTQYNGTARKHLARLSSTGTLDATFSTNVGSGFSTNPDVNAIAVQSDNKIIFAGNFNTFNGATRDAIVRLNADGSLDNTFSVAGLSGSYITSLALQPDGKILMTPSFGGGILRVTSTGEVDNTLNVGTGAGQMPGANNVVEAMVLQPDGKIIIAGHFTTYDDTPDGVANAKTANRIARLNSDGTLDASFNPSGTSSNSYIYTIALQSDGKILIGGGFSQYNGTARMYIARLNSDGTLDTSFDPGTGASGGYINTIDHTSTGMAVIGGDFTSYNGTSNTRLVQVYSSISPLPVSWLYFTGNATKEGNQLSWGTATEKDSRAFIVERSSDGVNFEAISEVEAAGNSTQENRYTFTDKNARVLGVKTLYYRLKQVDFSGSFEYSRIIALNGEGHNSVLNSVYPNPFTNELKLEFANALVKTQTMQIELTSMEGKTVYSEQVKRNPGVFQATLKNLPEIKAGIYLLKIISEEGTTIQKVIKQ